MAAWAIMIQNFFRTEILYKWIEVVIEDKLHNLGLYMKESPCFCLIQLF